MSSWDGVLGVIGANVFAGFAGVVGFLRIASGGEGWLNSDVMSVGPWLPICWAYGYCSVVHYRGWLTDWSHWCGSPNCSSLLDQLLCGWLVVQYTGVWLCALHPATMLNPVIPWILLTFLSDELWGVSWFLCIHGLIWVVKTGDFLHLVCWPVGQSTVASTIISTRQQFCSTGMLVPQ